MDGKNLCLVAGAGGIKDSLDIVWSREQNTA